VDSLPVGPMGEVLDPQRFVIERVRLEDLPDWCAQHGGLVPVCGLAWPDGDTWPPAVLYAPRPAWATGREGEQGESSIGSGENRRERGAPEAVAGNLKASAVQNSLPLF
jgi:hypothetical protein